ncbi:MAG: hypothetical protein DMF75_09305 [Acidobacteria bacterium]|nr:MAG: hypothetical protein DMF75_09305 [Acidobacteriota bacterium]
MKIENCKMKIANLIVGHRAPSSSRHRAESFSRPRAESFSQSCAVKLKNNFQFAISSRLLFALCSLLLALCSAAPAQTTADKMVATVTNGSRATPDLITYSDLVWQLTLEPSTPFSAKPSSEQLNKALRTLEDQLLILQEARKLPPANTPEAMQKFEDQVKQKRDQLVQGIGSRALFEERMKSVGLTAEQLDAILRDRVTIENYLDFRFRAFVLPPSAREISDRYNQDYGRLRNTGRIVPTLEQVRDRLEHDLTEEKIESEIDKFVDNLREQPGTEIVVLSPV